VTGEVAAFAAQLGTLAIRLLEEPIVFHETLGLLIDDRAVLLTELAASQNNRAQSRARH